MWRNTYNLGIYNKDSQVKIVNGMKFLMMLLIIYGHVLLYILGFPQFNPASLEEVSSFLSIKVTSTLPFRTSSPQTNW